MRPRLLWDGFVILWLQPMGPSSILLQCGALRMCTGRLGEGAGESIYCGWADDI